MTIVSLISIPQKYTMKNLHAHQWLRPGLTSILFALAMLLTACEDAPVGNSNAVPGTPYDISRIDDQGIQILAEIPSFEEVVSGKGSGFGKLVTHDGHQHDTIHHDTTHHDTTHHDTTGHDPDPHDTTHHDPPDHDTTHHDTTHHDTTHRDPPAHDTTHHRGHHPGGAEVWQDLTLDHDLHALKPHSYSHVPGKLGLSHTQDSLFRLAIHAYNERVNAAYHRYIEARRMRLDTLNDRLHELHDAIHAGEISETHARDSVDALIADYRHDVHGLGRDLADDIAEAAAILDQTVRAFLTSHQIEIWEHLT